MASWPGGRVVTRVATPFTKVTGGPRFAPFCWNCTVPVGAFPVTVAVRVTGVPRLAGFGGTLTGTELRVSRLAAATSKLPKPVVKSQPGPALKSPFDPDVTS